MAISSEIASSVAMLLPRNDRTQFFQTFYIIFITLIFLLAGSPLFAQGISDIEHRLGIKKTEKKAPSDKGFKQEIGEHYIVQVKDISREEAGLILKHMERILEEYTKLYEYPFGTQKCFVKVYGEEEDFRKDGRFKVGEDTGGYYYSTGVNYFVVTYNSPHLYSVLSHEAFHQFAEKAFGREPSVWFNEGMACYYETCKFVNDKFVTNITNSGELFTAKQAISGKNKDWPKLKELVRLDYDGFHGKGSSLNYAASWSLIYYLKNKDEKAFSVFVNDIRLGKSFSTCIRTNYNMDMKELEKEWLEYIKALPGS